MSKYASVILRKCIFELNRITINSLNQYWPSLFDSSLGTNRGISGATGISIADMFWNDGLASFEDVASYFENVTQAPTTHIRQLGDSTFASTTQGRRLAEHDVRTYACAGNSWSSLPSSSP
jgi:hypothetical protein